MEQEQREHEATRRARVEANVRAALAAREQEPEAVVGGTNDRQPAPWRSEQQQKHWPF